MNTTKHLFDLPNGHKITVLVMSPEEFKELLDSLEGITEVSSGQRADELTLDRIRRLGHLPMMARGYKTQEIFTKYEVQTDYISAIVRGKGPEVLQQFVQQDAQNNSLELPCIAIAWIAPEDFDQVAPLCADFPPGATYEDWLALTTEYAKNLPPFLRIYLRPDQLSAYMADKGITKISSQERAEYVVKVAASGIPENLSVQESAEYAAKIAALGLSETPVAEVAEGHRDLVDVQIDFAIAYYIIIFEAMPQASKIAILSVAKLVMELIQTKQSTDQEILWWIKNNAKGLKRRNWESLVTQTVNSIGCTLQNMVAAGVEDQAHFRDYLARLFTGDLFTLDIMIANGIPEYIKGMDQTLRAKFDQALSMVNMNYETWCKEVTVHQEES